MQKQKTPQCGYSLIEASMVLLAAMVLMAAAIPIYTNAISRTSADGAAQLIAQELSYARALAVGSRASVLVQFSPDNNTFVVAPSSGQVRGPFPLPSGMRYSNTAFSPDTPDSLGSTVLAAGSISRLTFLDNGAAIDDPATNNLRSGTFFLEHINGDQGSRRAVTLIGGTGRVHIWRYDGTTSTWK